MNARRAPKRKSSRGKHRFLWVLDPWETLDHAQDTTLLLAKTAAALGHESLLAHPTSLTADPEHQHLTVETWNLTHQVCTPHVPLKDFTQIHYRVDPPVDQKYREPLELLHAAKLPVVNAAQTLLTESEKLIACAVPRLAPPTQVVNSLGALHALSHQASWQTQTPWVLKPLGQAQSKGVQLWTPGKSPAPSFANGALVVQPFLPEIHTQGELRTWWVNGTFLAAVRKHPLAGDFKVQIDAGSPVVALDGPRGGIGQIPKAVRRKFPAVQKLLRQKQIHLAAVDWIGEWVSDFNFTSPGLLVQMQALIGQDLAAQIIRSLTARPLRLPSR